MKPSNIYIGIDNGLTGGMVALSDHPGPIISSTIMPTRGKSKGNEIDAAWIANWLANWDVTRITVILETPGKFSAGTQALCSMWDSYGAIRGVLESRGIRHHRIPPQKWQKVMIPNCAKGDTKPAALAKARQLWPDETWLASARCSKPHDGIVDSALIGEYGRLMRL